MSDPDLFSALDRLIAQMSRIAQMPRRMQDIMRKHHYKFERFPRDMEAQPPRGDGERWEALAFSLYADLGEAALIAERSVDELTELLAVVRAPQPQEKA